MLLLALVVVVFLAADVLVILFLCVYCAYFFFPSFWLFRFNFAFAYCCFSTYDYFVFCMAFNELLWRLFAMNPSNEFRNTTSWYGVSICCHFQNSKHIDIVGFTTDCLHIYLCFSFVFLLCISWKQICQSEFYIHVISNFLVSFFWTCNLENEMWSINKKQTWNWMFDTIIALQCDNSKTFNVTSSLSISSKLDLFNIW